MSTGDLRVLINGLKELTQHNKILCKDIEDIKAYIQAQKDKAEHRARIMRLVVERVAFPVIVGIIMFLVGKYA